jgi:hypothetical protein
VTYIAAGATVSDSERAAVSGDADESATVTVKVVVPVAVDTPEMTP